MAELRAFGRFIVIGLLIGHQINIAVFVGDVGIFRAEEAVVVGEPIPLLTVDSRNLDFIRSLSVIAGHLVDQFLSIGEVAKSAEGEFALVGIGLVEGVIILEAISGRIVGEFIGNLEREFAVNIDGSVVGHRAGIIVSGGFRSVIVGLVGTADIDADADVSRFKLLVGGIGRRNVRQIANHVDGDHDDEIDTKPTKDHQAAGVTIFGADGANTGVVDSGVATTNNFDFLASVSYVKSIESETENDTDYDIENGIRPRSGLIIGENCGESKHCKLRENQ